MQVVTPRKLAELEQEWRRQQQELAEDSTGTKKANIMQVCHLCTGIVLCAASIVKTYLLGGFCCSVLLTSSSQASQEKKHRDRD